MTLICRTCKKEKSADIFSPSTINKSGYRGTCRPCRVIAQRKYVNLNRKKVAKSHKNWYTRNIEKIRQASKIKYKNNKLKDKDKLLKRKYNISLEYYNYLLIKQNCVCAICGEFQKSSHAGRTRGLAVDHDHNTGLVRGLLCSRCNLCIGHMNESRTLLMRAIDYLITNGTTVMEVIDIKKAI